MNSDLILGISILALLILFLYTISILNKIIDKKNKEILRLKKEAGESS